MVMYIYNTDYTYKCSKEQKGGIVFANATKKAPDFKKYPLDKYTCKFDIDSNEWKYEAIPEPEEEKEPEPVSEETLAKYSKLSSYRQSKNDYDTLVKTLRMLKPVLNQETYSDTLSSLNTKRLDYNTKIKDLEEELNSGN